MSPIRVACIGVVASLAIVTSCAAEEDLAAFGKCQITVETAGGPVVFKADYADQPETRQRGLMFRENMDDRTGMFFRFENVGTVSMWMKNTLLPLDMIFVGADDAVISVHEGAVPGSLDVISSQAPALYVLEVNAGEAQAAGIEKGQQVQHDCMPAG